MHSKPAACAALAFKLFARPFAQVPEFADVRLECGLSNDSSIRCASEPGRTETQTETRQDHGIPSPSFLDKLIFEGNFTGQDQFPMIKVL